MEIICMQAQSSEIEAASMAMGMDGIDLGHAEDGLDGSSAATDAESADSSSATLLDGASSNSALASSSSSASALSEAISTLVQSHLSQSSRLEDEWDLRLSAWLKSTRGKVRRFLRDTSEEFIERSNLRLAAQQQHERALAAAEELSLKHRRTKMNPSEEEEKDEQRMRRELRQKTRVDPLDFMQLYTNVKEVENEMKRINRHEMIHGIQEEEEEEEEEHDTGAQTESKPSSTAASPGTATPITASSPSPAASSSPSPSSAPFASVSSPHFHPPPALPPFPLRSLHSSSLFVGSAGSTKLIHVHLTNQPMFISWKMEKGGATINHAAATSTQTAQVGMAGMHQHQRHGRNASSSTSDSTAPVVTSPTPLPLSSSPLISLPHFVDTLDSLFGTSPTMAAHSDSTTRDHAAGSSIGPHATFLPHHSSPLLHAPLEGEEKGSESESENESESEAEHDHGENEHADADELNQPVDAAANSEPTSTSPSSSSSSSSSLLRRDREHAQHSFNLSNVYVKNWLSFMRTQPDLLLPTFQTQMKKIQRTIRRARRRKENEEKQTDKQVGHRHICENGATRGQENVDGSMADDAHAHNGDSTRGHAAAPSVSSSCVVPTAQLLHPGDVVISKHSNVLNGQITFHVHVKPRRGGAASGCATGNGSGSNDNDNEHGSESESVSGSMDGMDGDGHVARLSLVHTLGSESVALESVSSLAGSQPSTANTTDDAETERDESVRDSASALGLHHSTHSQSPSPSPSPSQPPRPPSGIVSGVLLTDNEMKQQIRLFSVLSHLFHVCCSVGVRSVSLPLIWDNILLSMWSLSGSYVGFGWKEMEESRGQGEGHGKMNGSMSATSDYPSSSIRSLSADRMEEYEVYECMVRYLDSHMRAVKHCLASLPADASLQHVVFFLPPPTSQTGSTLDAYDEQGDMADMMENEAASTIDHTNAVSHTHTHTHTHAQGRTHHPFLSKCKRIFEEVFQ